MLPSACAVAEIPAHDIMRDICYSAAYCQYCHLVFSLVGERCCTYRQTAVVSRRCGGDEKVFEKTPGRNRETREAEIGNEVVHFSISHF